MIDLPVTGMTEIDKNSGHRKRERRPEFLFLWNKKVLVSHCKKSEGFCLPILKTFLRDRTIYKCKGHSHKPVEENEKDGMI